MSVLAPDLLARLKAEIARHRLEGAADLILRCASECYAMEVVAEDDYRRVGGTRFGGDPDLPAGFDWPSAVGPGGRDRRYSNFVAQIDFAELPPLAAGSPLPRSGLLYLFVRSMESAADPVLLDAHFFDGARRSLRRVPSPDADELADEYLADLIPHRVRAVPAVSLPFYSKAFRAALEDGRDFHWHDLDPEPARGPRVGQLLGYANARDVRQNLYRHVVLGRLGRRELIYNDYWSSVGEYEAYIREWAGKGEKDLVTMYEEMRPGVTWLVDRREEIGRAEAEWRLLFRLDSNAPMNLSINDADPLYAFVRQGELAAGRFGDLAGEVTQG
jgi:uncharacterized protein YwqG